MKIKTITCHDVYNAGASLQAYALLTYLTDLGHDVEIIDYKPDYLNRHYSFTHIPNPRFHKPLLRKAYLIAKFPGRLKAYFSTRKKNFDNFRNTYLNLTRRYNSYEDLEVNPPEGDIYFAGSDQIWNPLFPNGKDPAFYLQFVPNKKVRASFAASFAVEEIPEEIFEQISKMTRSLDFVSVREKSALDILDRMNIPGIAVCDPVFLLEDNRWKEIARNISEKEYCLIYDFDESDKMTNIIHFLKKENNCNICSVFSHKEADKILNNMGPREFVGAVLCAKTIISNSFHATAFALIFHKDFYVLRREEHINTRMEDLLADVGLSDRLIESVDDMVHVSEIDWDQVEERLKEKKTVSIDYINRVING